MYILLDALTIQYFKPAPASQPAKSVVLRGLFWDSGSGFHNPSSSPLPHPAKSSPFSAFKCPLISLAHCDSLYGCNLACTYLSPAPGSHL